MRSECAHDGVSSACLGERRPMAHSFHKPLHVVKEPLMLVRIGQPLPDPSRLVRS
jgi:hypothetical protein